MSDDVITKHVIITGRVQGVWFRSWTKKKADKLGLNGWVKNRNDGAVEAVFSGTQQNIDAMIKACKSGPPLARVGDVAISPESNPPNEPGFHTRYEE